MCGFCLERDCTTECVQKFEERLNSMSERLFNSFNSTRQSIDTEVTKLSRTMCDRRQWLLQKLESQFKEDVQFVQKLVGLLEYAKICNDSERNGVIAYIESQMNRKFGKNNGNFSFNCNSSCLREAILCSGAIERNAVEMNSLSQYLFADKPLSSWLHKDRLSAAKSQEIDAQSIATELESFELLDSTPTTSRTCSLCVCEKPDCTPVVVPDKDCSETPGLCAPETHNLFPSISKDTKAWVSKNCKPENSTEKDLEVKMEALGIKSESDKPARDIESPIGESSCKSTTGDSVCKLFGSCTFQGLDDAMTIPVKPCVKAWLKNQRFDRGVKTENTGTSDDINHLRKIGATDSAMWLSGKRTNAMAFDQSSERIFAPTNQSRGDNLCELWLRDWCEQAGNPPNSGEVDFQIVKRSKLANFLLDSQQNFEADLEAILYRSPFPVRTTAHWLQPTNANRKITGPA